MNPLNNIVLLLCVSAIIGASVNRLKSNDEYALEELQALLNDSENLRIEERTVRYEETLPLDPPENNFAVGPGVIITRIARNIYNVVSSMSIPEYGWAYSLKGMVSMIFGLCGDLLMPLVSSAAVMIIRSLT